MKNALSYWITLFVIFLLTNNTNAQTLIFSQDFAGASVGTTINTYGAITSSDYVASTSPSSSQFTSIIAGKQSTSNVDINTTTAGNFVVTSNGSSFLWCMTRSVDLTSPAPTALMIKMKSKHDITSTGSAGKFTICVGEGLVDDPSTAAAIKPATSVVHSGFMMRYANSAYGQIYDYAGSTALSSSNMTSQEATDVVWTFVVNNTGSDITYTAPDGSSETLANDTWDLWFDNTKWINDSPATTATTGIGQFKIGDLSSAGRAAWNIDYIKVYDLSTLGLPKLTAPTTEAATAITTSSFTAKWNAVANAVGYTVNIYQGTTVVGNYDVSGQATTSYIETGLTAKTGYTYTVIAKGDGITYGNSAESTPATAVTTLSSDKAITAFTAFGVTGVITEATHTIAVTVPYSTDMTVAQTPTVTVSSLASYSPTASQTFVSGTAVTYTVTAQDGSTQNYAVTVTKAPASSAKAITAFSLLGATGVIDETAKTIAVTVPASSDLTIAQTPTVTTSSLNTSPYSPTTSQIFTAGTAVTYTVTAEDGSKQDYAVTVTKAPASSAKAITAFTLLGANGVIDETTHTISVVVPFASDLTIAQTPTTVTVSSLATYSPTGSQIFTAGTPVTYTVTAEDGSLQDYAVTVTKDKGSNACDVTAFSVGVANEIVLIDNSSSTITVSVGVATNSLTPTITTSPLSSYSPTTLPTDFTNPVQIIVTAQDGTKKTFTVTVTKETSAPTVISNPANGGNVATATGNITLTFNRKVTLASGGTLTLTDKSTNTPVTLTPNTVPATGSTTITIPYSGLVNGDYTFEYIAGTFIDLFGNSALAYSATFTKSESTSCGAGTISVTLFNEDFGTFADVSERRDTSTYFNTVKYGKIPSTLITYSASGNIPDSKFAVVADAKNGASWAVSGEDHTSLVAPYPSGTYGGFLFFNAGNTAGEVFLSTEINICSGTDLECSAWYANMNPGSGKALPDITFKIWGKDPVSGTYVLTPYTASASPAISTTGNIEWTLLQLNFNSGTYSTIKLEVTNNKSATSGNDIGIDDIKIKACIKTIGLTISGTQTDIIVSDSTKTTIPVIADFSAGQYYLLQSSTDGITWKSEGAPTLETNTRNIDISSFCGKTYLRFIVAGDIPTCLSVANNTPSGCYTVTQSVSITKQCVAPTISLNTDKTLVCPNGQAILTARWVSGGYGDIVNWKWESSTDNGTTWSTITSPAFDKGISMLTVNPTVKTLYKVTTENKTCSSLTTSCTATVQPVTVDVVAPITNTLKVNNLDNTAVCDGTPITLTTSESGPITSSSWQSSTDGGITWNTLNGSSLYTETPHTSTLYKFTSVASTPYGDVCQTEEKTVSVQVNPTFEVTDITLESPNFLASNFLPVVGGTVTVTAITTAANTTGFTYNWTSIHDGAITPSITTVPSFTENITKNSSYSVTVIDKDRLCRASFKSDSITLGSIRLSTLITPNGLENRTFGLEDIDSGKALTENLGDYTLFIMNRYGQTISETKNTGWEGKHNGSIADAGVYFYILQYKDANGKLKEMKGSVEMVK